MLREVLLLLVDACVSSVMVVKEGENKLVKAGYIEEA